jgi:hypothetical protein
MERENATAETAGGGSRRDYLKSAWKVLGVVAAAEFVAVVGAFLWPRAKGEDELLWTSSPCASNPGS